MVLCFREVLSWHWVHIMMAFLNRGSSFCCCRRLSAGSAMGSRSYWVIVCTVSCVTQKQTPRILWRVCVCACVCQIPIVSNDKHGRVCNLPIFYNKVEVCYRWVIIYLHMHLGKLFISLQHWVLRRQRQGGWGGGAGPPKHNWSAPAPSQKEVTGHDHFPQKTMLHPSPQIMLMIFIEWQATCITVAWISSIPGKQYICCANYRFSLPQETPSSCFTLSSKHYPCKKCPVL